MIDLPQSPARLVAPSILSADFARLGAEIQAVEAGGADWIHVDVMDGRFVPNITIGPPVVRSIRKVTRLPLDVHLMIEQPEQHIAEFVEAGADIVTIHAEACLHLNRIIAQIHQAGARAGVSVNPATGVEVLRWLAADLDLILVMSVNPGFGGQRFLPHTLQKLEELGTLLDSLGHRPLIEVDGGVGPDNAAALYQRKVDVLVAGNAVFRSSDYASVIRRLHHPTGQ
ncbi:MAG: ribulose-phosphate 3-epimerase [Bradymonadales bacterium]|nr:ribulose-phosphate 3-epimerase [Bradymonadales bacterium]